MPIYRLAPIPSRRDDPQWAGSYLTEECWVLMPDEHSARMLVASATMKMQDVVYGQKIKAPMEPWMDPAITTCAISASVLAVPEGQIILSNGKPFV